VARNGPEFEKMTMEKQKDNPKFSFLFGGEHFGYYKLRLAAEQQPRELAPISITFSSLGTPPLATPPPPPVEQLIQQSRWNLQQQEQHLHALRQEQVSAAIAAAAERRTQQLLQETQLDVGEFDALLQPIVDTCTKDAISAGKNWMFSNAKTPQHCQLMTAHLRDRVTADTAHFELRLHLIYLTNDVLHHCQRKQQKDLLAALQKVVVPIYCTSFLSVEEDKQQKITRLLQLWEKNGYFDEETIQQLQNPALGLGQYQAALITEYAAVVQPVQLAFQQQIQALKTQHEDFVLTLTAMIQARLVRPAAHGALEPLPAGKPPPPPLTPPPSLSGSGLSALSTPQPPFDPNQPPPPCPPWNSHEGMWSEPRDPPGGWSGGPPPPPRDAGLWSGSEPGPPGPPCWKSYDQQQQQQQQQQAPWGGQPEGPPWGQREPPFPPRMQRPPHFRGPFPPQPPFNQPPPPPPHSFGRFPPRFMQDDFPPRHHFERAPYPPHRFDYAQGDFPGGPPPPPHHHHPNQRLPPPGMGGDHPPWGGGPPPPPPPPPHGFNGHSPHVRQRPPPAQEDPSLVPNVPYFDLPAGLMAPLVQLEDSDYKALDPKDIRLPPSHDRPRNRGRSSSRSSSPSSKSSRSRSSSSSRSSSGSRSRSRSSGSRSRSRSPAKPRRSPPPSSSSSSPSQQAGPPAGSSKGGPDSRLGEENKGHQLLMKMGWSGSGGLGAKEQGIQDPIKGGDVRDKWDQYKGVGVSLDDPYENYRRNKSYNFVARMKAREEGRGGVHRVYIWTRDRV
uniref:Calcium homeostasis endoplasmic reticulum protein n=1 Tax=Salarias fasciatus TaxID=181472 RepID=A0A672FDX9_SALFA